jgi:hypothetical protein
MAGLLAARPLAQFPVSRASRPLPYTDLAPSSVGYQADREAPGKAWVVPLSCGEPGLIHREPERQARFRRKRDSPDDSLLRAKQSDGNDDCMKDVSQGAHRRGGDATANRSRARRFRFRFNLLDRDRVRGSVVRADHGSTVSFPFPTLVVHRLANYYGESVNDSDQVELNTKEQG